MKVFTVQLPTPADGDVSTTTITTVTGNFKGSVTHQGFQIVHLWFVIGICVFSFHTPLSLICTHWGKLPAQLPPPRPVDLLIPLAAAVPFFGVWDRIELLLRGLAHLPVFRVL